MRSSTRVIGRLLLACVTEHDWSAPSAQVSELAASAPLDRLPESAVFHGVTGYVHRELAAAGAVDTAVMASLEQAHDAALHDHLRTIGDLRRLAPALDALGVPWLVVKGPVLAESMYPHPDLRSYVDLDVVVPADRLASVLGALHDAGGVLVDRNLILLRRQLFGELHVQLAHGTLLDLHWQLLNQASLRQVFRIPMAELFERARLVRIGALQVPTLDPADTLIHLALHACLSGGNRLVWLKDVERAVGVDAPSWEVVVARSHAWGVGTPVAVTLLRARRTLAAPVPEDVVRALAPAAVWPTAVALADRLSPVERSRGQRSIARMVSRSTRGDDRASLTELGRHLLGFARSNPLKRQPPTEPDHRGADSLLYPAGDRRDLDAYLSSVADQR